MGCYVEFREQWIPLNPEPLWFPFPQYLDGMVDAMNYLLGMNGMGQSYVTGYGSRPLTNPHHRFWAHELAPNLPGPPPGCLSGGPNSDLQDPKVQEAGLAGCKPQK